MCWLHSNTKTRNTNCVSNDITYLARRDIYPWVCCSGTIHIQYFAIDNSEFNEDTPDGKRTLHATATALYQRQDPADQTPDIIALAVNGSRKSLAELPPEITTLLPCSIPASVKPKVTPYPSFTIDHYSEDMKSFTVKDAVWLFSRPVLRMKQHTEINDLRNDEANNPED